MAFAIAAGDITVGGKTNITSNTMNSTAGSPAANDIDLDPRTGSVMIATNNTMNSNAAFNIFTTSSGGDVTISGNSITRLGSSVGASHSIANVLGGTSNLTITGNTIVSFVTPLAADGINITTSSTPTVGINVSDNSLANVPSTNGVSLRGNAGSTYCVKMKNNASITFPTSPIQFTLNANGGVINFQAADPAHLQADNDQPSTNTFVYTPPSSPNANLIFGSSCSAP